MAEERGFAAVILAAGQGKRMKSDLPKVLHPVGGVSMCERVIGAAEEAGADPVVLVVGHRADLVMAALGNRVAYARQEKQLGTGHAVAQAKGLLRAEETILILCGDTPLLTGATLRNLLRTHRETGAAITLLSAIVQDPGGYGRVVREEGRIRRIVEEADAGPEEKAIREINAGIYVFQAPVLWEALEGLVSDNAQGEFYLTDCVAAAVERGHAVAGALADPEEVEGVNNPEQLARAEAILKRRKDDAKP